MDLPGLLYVACFAVIQFTEKHAFTIPIIKTLSTISRNILRHYVIFSSHLQETSLFHCAYNNRINFSVKKNRC